MNRFLGRYLMGMAFAACLFVGSASFAAGDPVVTLFFNSVSFVYQENSPTGPNTYEFVINGKIKDMELPILLSFKKLNLSNANHRAIMDYCEKSALLAMNNPGRYLLSVFGASNTAGGQYTVDFSSNDRVLCKLSTPN